MTHPHQPYSQVDDSDAHSCVPANQPGITATLESNAEAGSTRKTYRSPILQTYGTVKALTQGIGSFSGDGGTMRDMAATMSDARAKNVVAKVGEHPAGFGLYLFQYKPSLVPTAEVGLKFGVLAQEVMVHAPESVITGPDGYLRVDYESLGITLP